MKKVLLLSLIFCLSLPVFSANKQKGYKIEIVAPQLKNHNINLGVYFYGKLYSRDSVMLDDKGMGAFQKDKVLPEGMYVVYYSNSDYFDVLMSDDQTFKIQIDTTDFSKNVYTDAEQTKVFAEYVNFLGECRKEVKRINEDKKEKNEEKKTEAISAIDNMVKEKQNALKTAYAGKTLGIFLSATDQIDVPKFEEIENDSIRRVKKYYWYREHYFDNINLSDPRLVYSPFLEPKVTQYVEQVIPQMPDTLSIEIVKLIEKTKGDTLTFQNMLSNMLNYAVKSNVMGMDRVTLTLAEKYYLSGEAYWADSTLLSQLSDEVKKIKYNQVGDPARDLVVETFEGEKIRVSTLNADYILLFFFEPSCGHCKVETPKLYKEIYQKYKDQSLEIVCFYIQQDRDEWKEFLDKNDLYGWRNVWDPNRESYFWYFYDVSTTPGVYLIDKDRNILAKKISVETLDGILANEFGMEKTNFEKNKDEKK